MNLSKQHAAAIAKYRHVPAPIVPSSGWVYVLLASYCVRQPLEHAIAFVRAGYTAADLSKTLASGELKSSPFGPLIFAEKP